MNTSESFRALQGANPRGKDGFTQLVETAAEAVGAQIDATVSDLGTGSGASGHRAGRPSPRGRLTRASVVGALAAAAAAVAFLTVGSPGGGPGVENAAAAVTRAATLTTAAAERSGTAVVRMTHNGKPWAGKTVRWNGADVAIAEDAPRRPGRAGGELRVVDGTLYTPDPDGGWVVLGKPENIDPDSGTTPGEYLAAVREDIGGVTLGRITGGMTGLTATQLDDGSTIYGGAVAAGLIAGETGFKDGEAIRVLPFGYVAHDEAADPNAPLDVAVTVGADGIVRKLAVTWGASVLAWTYTVTYVDLGVTAAPLAPENARPLRDWSPTKP